MTIQAVKSRFKLPPGYKLYVSHFRMYKDWIDGNPYIADIQLDRDDVLLHTGGVTLVDVLDESDQWITCGQSVCSAKDTYNKKVGRDIAAGRALKNLDKLLGEEYAVGLS